MEANGGLTAADVMALTNGNDKFDDIMGLLVIAGIFNGGLFGGNNNNIENRFIERDIFATNTNVLESANATQTEVQNSKYDTTVNSMNRSFDVEKQVLENRNATSLGFANAQKDILLGNQTIQSQMAQNALSAQASQAQCCCDLKTAIHAEGEATRAQAADYRMRDLEKQVSGYELVAALGNQTNTLSARFGQFFPNPPYNPYSIYGNGGTTIA